MTEEAMDPSQDESSEDRAVAPTADSIVRTSYAAMVQAQADMDKADGILKANTPTSVSRAMQPYISKASGDLNTPIAQAEVYIQANPVVTPPPVVVPPPVVIPPPPVIVTPPSGRPTLAQVAAMVDPQFTKAVFDVDYTVANPPDWKKDWVAGVEGGPGGIWPPNYDRGGNGDETYNDAAITVVEGQGLILPVSQVSAGNYTSTAISDYGKHTVPVGTPTLDISDDTVPDASTGLWPADWALEDANASPLTSNEETDNYEMGINPTQAAVNTKKVPASVNTALVSNYHPTPQSGAQSETYDTGIDMSKTGMIKGRAYYPGVKVVLFYVDPSTNKLVIYRTMTNVGKSPHCSIIQTQVASAATKGWHTQVGANTPKSAAITIARRARYIPA